MMNQITLNLNELAEKYGTDKGSSGHGYMKYYETHFAEYKDIALDVMEIGVREGNSLLVWNDYFTRADITGVDNNAEGKTPQKLWGNKDHGKITIKFLDQTKVAEAYDDSTFDIVIDDASHISSLTIETFKTMWPLVDKGGMYVIEDMHVCHEPRFNPDNFSTLQFLAQLNHKKLGIETLTILENKIAFIKKVKGFSILDGSK